VGRDKLYGAENVEAEGARGSHDGVVFFANSISEGWDGVPRGRRGAVSIAPARLSRALAVKGWKVCGPVGGINTCLEEEIVAHVVVAGTVGEFESELLPNRGRLNPSI
jgi:hypothetical protein